MEQTLINNQRQHILPILSTFGVSFFIWGIITVLNTVLIGHLKSIFGLNELEFSDSISSLINLVFFSTYLLVSLPAGKLVQFWGYKLCLIIGLFTTGLGCMLFYFAINLKEYYFFLLAMAVQATGITLLQVTANLYIIFFGSSKTAPSRLTLMQGFNALGAFLAPVYASPFVENIFGLQNGIASSAVKVTYVQSPYIILSIIMYVLTIFFVFVDIPEYSTVGIEPLNKQSKAIRRSHVMHFKQLRLGAFALFAYLGAEVYLGTESDLQKYFPQYEEFYWGAALVGRIIGGILLFWIGPRKVLTFCASVATFLLIVAILSPNYIAVWVAISIGLFNSVMFPCIFALGLNGLGKFSEEGAAIMIMAFVGAGVIPFNAGNFSSVFGYKVGFIFPFVCYLYILFYAMRGSKFKKRDDVVETKGLFTIK